MNVYLMLIVMIFCHIVDDYYLQGILASMKQRGWWEKNAPSPLYKDDYKCALFMHSFSWSFMIMLPLLIFFSFEPPVIWYFCFVANVLMHGAIDDEKANDKTINLWTDQSLHMFQIVGTLLCCYFIGD